MDASVSLLNWNDILSGNHGNHQNRILNGKNGESQFSKRGKFEESQEYDSVCRTKECFQIGWFYIQANKKYK